MDIDIQPVFDIHRYSPTRLRPPTLPAPPTNPVARALVTTANQATSGADSAKDIRCQTVGPPKAKSPSPIYLRDKGKRNTVSAECNRLHINYTRARNMLHGIKISADSISDFRSLSSFIIKNNLSFHIYVLEEELTIKAVLKNIPLEILTNSMKSGLENQDYSVFAGHRIHHRDDTELGLALAVLHKTNTAKNIFKTPRKYVASAV
ncbi:hypothetical protein EVAR_54188_1 [Eumeta japonica]|uniref:Uncharacterized protein n=1 Tax=Eumeta variegata TaxID=151549 RepID=A0A4C1ZEK8_EUMVA|nr:hypothetical protein EVAR_54188_1 [Eumeta japonica]